MKRLLLLLTAGMLLMTVTVSCQSDPEPEVTPPPAKVEPVAVSKTNSTKLYIHYMPWFETPEFSGYWGFHWTMNNRNPDAILTNGNRDIAAHYYPLIGPYDSVDPDVIDYHVLLMKYAGVDGVLIDWYGTHEVADYDENLENSEEFIDGVKRAGLEFAIVYEEFTAENVGNETGITDIQAAKQDVAYMQQRYWNQDEYITIDDNPLLLTFGPRYFNSPTQWDDILGVLSDNPVFMPLWNATARVGDNNADGEFSWIDFTPNLDELENFYQRNDLIIGSAYPGFHDFYEEGAAGTSFGFVNHLDGQTLRNTLNKAADNNLPYLQLATWNDFGEGTIFEPTQEFGYSFLEILQEYAGVSYSIDELELIHTYYLKRKELAEDEAAQETLDEVFDALIQLEVDAAASLLASL